MSVQEKEALLEEFTQEETFSYSFIGLVTLSLLIVMALFLPKIYISTHIYYTSVEINKLKDRYYSLREEQEILQSKIDKLKFNNRVTH